MISDIPKDPIELYTTMFLIRRVEERLMEIFSAGEIPGFLHVCIGQEAAPAAVCSLLTDEDYVGATHRGHGHAIAKGVDLKLFMAELFGKKSGFCMGRSGSMHLSDKRLGILGANGIVGGGIPIATGAAFAARHKYPGRVSVCFFGDGATDQGTFHESLNMASLWKLPIVYVCENNGWAEFSPQKVHMPVADIAVRAASFGMPSQTVQNDALEIQAAAITAVNRAREGNGPTLLEVKCKRWHGHYVGDPQKYRDKEEVEGAINEDCLKKLEGYLIQQKILTKKTAREIAETVNEEIARAVEFAQNSPAPSASELAESLYV